MKINLLAKTGFAIVMAILAISCNRGTNASAVQSAAQSVSAVPYTIEVGGSTSVTPLMEMFADEYSKSKSHIKVNINGTGSGDGITNAGVTYQIGMSSRDLTPAEQGRGLNAEIVAIDGIAVIINKNNSVSSLSIEQIRGIYTGEITNWNQVGGSAGAIAVVSREAGSGTRGAFEELVGFQGKLLAGANESTSTGAIKAGIAQNPHAIGYISLGSVDDSIKAISIGGVAPLVANVTNGSYKIARPFIVLTGNNVHAESKAFIEWMLSPAGQAIVSKSWIKVR
ncbi:MAG: phosphate ABC transporter substrate-binding protein [Treponema sp.]|nr:phosphate ABC transporter substrate-binding protein [Treponema sp.]MCL2250403.1 phosphate ABC transporter substrate-binding protein [Treponema sp.]